MPELSFKLLAHLGSLLCIGLGIFASLAPARVAKLVSIQALGGPGVSEIRATYGGLFLAMGLACLLLQSPHAYLVAGAAWLGAACMRFPSLWLDQGSYPKALGGALMESTIAALLFTGAL